MDISECQKEIKYVISFKLSTIKNLSPGVISLFKPADGLKSSPARADDSS